jgi:hypothetical protein
LTSYELGLESKNLLFAKHDSAAVNGAAMSHLKPFYKNLNDNPCISHIISNIGQKFAITCPLAYSFVSDFLSLLRHSPRAAMMLKIQTGNRLNANNFINTILTSAYITL